MASSITKFVMKHFPRKVAFLAALLFLVCTVIPFSSVLADTRISAVTVEFDAVKAGDSVSSFCSSVTTPTPTVDESSLYAAVTTSDKTFEAEKSYAITVTGSALSGYYFPTSNLKFIVNVGESRASSTNSAPATADSFTYAFTYKVPTAVSVAKEQPKPTVTKSPSDETVEAGGSCSFIAKADVETHIDWYFIGTDGKEYDCSDAKSALKGLKIKGNKDEKIILSNIPIEMDGWQIFCVFLNDKNESTETKKATIHVKKAKPVVTKSPSGETVAEGGKCSFIARADGAETITWYLTNGSKTYAAKSAAKKFSGLSVSGLSEEKLVLDSIPVSLSGWSAYAEFENESGKVQSEKATITVNAAATPKPTATPTPTVTATPDIPEQDESEPGVAAGDTDIPETAEEAEHEHSFSAEWSADETGHYHLCECGEHSDVEAHSMVSQVTKKATRKEAGEQVSVCTVCGYTDVMVLPATGNGGTKSLLVALLVICVVLLIGVVVFLGVYLLKEYRAKQRKERRRARDEEADFDGEFDE